MLWVYIVAAMIISLVLIELVAWTRRQRSAALELAAETDDTAGTVVEGADAGAVDETGAELARAAMKIAILESRLEEQAMRNEAEVTAIEDRYRKLMAQTEAAYQKQMVSMSDRLAAQGREQARESGGRDGEKEYEVRLANEVAAWLARFEQVTEEPSHDAPAMMPEDENATEEAPEAVSDSVAAPAASEHEGMRDGREAVGEPDEPAVPLPQPVALLPAVAGGGRDMLTGDHERASREWMLEVAPAYGGAVLNEAHHAPVVAAQTADDSLLAQIHVLDEATAGPLAAEDPEGSGVKDAIKIGEAAPETAIIGYDTGEPDTTAPGKAQERSISEREDGRVQEAAPEQAAVAVSGGWPERRTRAVQRALARRLGAELDADYMDDEEFLRALGIEEQERETTILTAEQLEDIMGTDDWVMDPLQVMADYLRRQQADEAQAPETSGAPDQAAVNGKGRQTDDAQSDPTIWERLVLSDAPAADGANGHGNGTNGNGNGAGRSENGAKGLQPLELDDEEAAEVSAAVEAILSRAPSESTNKTSTEPSANGSEPSSKALSAKEPGELTEPEALAEPAVADQEQESGAARVEEPLAVADVSVDAAEDDNADAPAEASAAADEPAVPNSVPETEEQVAEVLESEEWLQTPAALDALHDAMQQEPLPTNAAPTRTVHHDAAAVSLLDAVAAAPVAQESFTWQRQPVTWQAHYFDNTRLAEEPAAIREDRDINFEWGGRAPAQGVQPRRFSVRWQGAIPLDEGRYRFTVTAPDGVRLWLNDRLVISAWYDQSEQTYQRDFAWHGGPVEVRVEHYENGGDARASLDWERVA